jgi:hypothetical protein
MQEPLPIPASISFRQLQAYALKAPAEPHGQPAADSPAANEAARDAATDLEAALETWNNLSQKLMQRLQQAGPVLGHGRSPQQLMALGALQAHLGLGLQALASSRRSQE